MESSAAARALQQSRPSPKAEKKKHSYGLKKTEYDRQQPSGSRLAVVVERKMPVKAAPCEIWTLPPSLDDTQLIRPLMLTKLEV